MRMTDEEQNCKPKLKLSKSHKRKKKQIPKEPLEFVESPIEGDIYAEPSIYPGSPRKVPTVKIGYDTSSNWVSPEAYSYNSVYPLRSAMRTRRTSRRTRLLKRTSNAENEPFSQSFKNSRKNNNIDNCKPLTPVRENCEPIPTCLATPNINLDLETSNELQTPSSFTADSVHFIFKGRTPTLKEFPVLVEDTPM